MANNTFQISGPQLTNAGGGWQQTTGATTTLGSTAGLSYRFEKFSNAASIVRFTVLGILVLSSVGGGLINYYINFPANSIPAWARPSPGVVGSTTVMLPDFNLATPSLTAARQGANGLVMQLTGPFQGTIVSSSTPIQWSLDYLSA